MEVNREMIERLKDITDRIMDLADKGYMLSFIERAEKLLPAPKIPFNKDAIPEVIRNMLTEDDIRGLEAAIASKQKIPAIKILREAVYRNNDRLGLADAKAMIDPFYDY